MPSAAKARREPPYTRRLDAWAEHADDEPSRESRVDPGTRGGQPGGTAEILHEARPRASNQISQKVLKNGRGRGRSSRTRGLHLGIWRGCHPGAVLPVP